MDLKSSAARDSLPHDHVISRPQHCTQMEVCTHLCLKGVSVSPEQVFHSFPHVRGDLVSIKCLDLFLHSSLGQETETDSQISKGIVAKVHKVHINAFHIIWGGVDWGGVDWGGVDWGGVLTGGGVDWGGVDWGGVLTGGVLTGGVLTGGVLTGGGC